MFLLLAPAASASQLDDKRKELQNINAQIEATQNKKGDAAKRQAKVRLQIQQSDQKMVQMQIKLNKLQAELNDIIAGKRDAEVKLDETQKRLGRAQANLAIARERLALRRGVYNKRLGSIYKNSTQSIIAVIFNAKDFSDLFTRVSLLSMIAEQDSKIVLDMKQLTATITNEVTQIAAMKNTIDQQRVRLVAEKKRIDVLMGDMVAQEKQLRDEMVNQQRLYAQIQQEKERLARAEGKLKASSLKVAGQIAMLDRGGNTVSRGARVPVSTPKELTALARSTAAKYGIPANIFFALIKQESGWNSRAVSYAGAIGLTQVMPFNVVAMGYNVKSFRNSPGSQLEAGARYLSQQYRTFDRWDFALAAYNAGPGAVLAYGGIPPYRETRNYVRSILRMAGQ